MKGSISVITTMCIVFVSAKQSEEYDVHLEWDLTVYQALCPNGKIPQPQPFQSKSDVEEWCVSFWRCFMGFFNEAADDDVTFSDIFADIIDDKSQFCFYDKHVDPNDADCYSMQSLSDYTQFVKHLMDWTEISFSVDTFNETSFTVYGEESGDLEITGIAGFGRGLFKNNKLEQTVTFKFDENGNGIIKTRNLLNDGGLYKKTVKWSKSKFASTLSESLSWFNQNIDNFNANNSYFEININKTITFLVIILCILLVILLIVCRITQWICCNKSQKRFNVAFDEFDDVINDPNTQEDTDDEERRKFVNI